MPEPSPFPTTINPTTSNTPSWRSHSSSSNNNSWHPFNHNVNWYSTPPTSGPPSSLGNCPSRPYLGYCQIYRIHGHTAKRCPSFRLVPFSSPSNNSTHPLNHPTSPWQPRAHYAPNSSSSPTWLLKNGASYYVTSDLTNLSLHIPYNGSNDIMIGDGSGLPITHIGSTSLTTSSQHNF